MSHKRALRSSVIANCSLPRFDYCFLSAHFSEMSSAEQSRLVFNALISVVAEISKLRDFSAPTKRQCDNIVRSVKLLSPLFEELRGSDVSLDTAAMQSFISLKTAFESAQLLLRNVIEGSKLYQVIKLETIANKFYEVTEQLEKALSEVHYETLVISDDVHEQVKLVHMQLKRAKLKPEAPDMQLFMDFCLAKSGKETDNATLRRLSKKLQLITVDDLNKESRAFHNMVKGEEPEDYLEEMSALLKKLGDFICSESEEKHTSENEKILIEHRCPVIPDDFRCPISHELMKDPVIVSSGQTYERSYIQKWVDAGHKTCPKTQHPLTHTSLTPNYALKSLIIQWCESNGIELSGKRGYLKSMTPGGDTLDCDREAIEALKEKLIYGTQDEQRAAAGQIRLLAKRNADNRICIAEVGFIPLLIELLTSSDLRTQEHAVTALLNLSINESNKSSIVNAGAIPDIVDVLKNGSTEARENAAAALFSLSVLDENKVAIGAAGAIPSLIDLLCQGSPRGKKDAATAIFSLVIYQGNKVKAVRAGIMDPLMRLLMDPSGGMVDEALAILAILTCHPEGKNAVGQFSPAPILVALLRTGSPRSRENAAAMLCALCLGDAQQLMTAREVGAEEVLKELLESGTERAKRKAGSLLELLKRLDASLL